MRRNLPGELNLQTANTIDFQAYINTTLGNVSQRKSLSIEQVRSIVRNNNRNIYAVVATPKSGSTFLYNVLMRALNLPYISLCYAYNSNEQDLYLPGLVVASTKGAVSQLHMKGTPHNVQLLNFFGIKPIILTRNIFDSVESLARDLRKKCKVNNLGPGENGYVGLGMNGYSFTWLTNDISKLNDEKLIDFVIDFALPWYVNFYVSWHGFANIGSINPLFIRYEDMMKDKEGAISKIIKAVGNSEVNLDISILDTNYIPEYKGINRGKGDSGLGLERLTKLQINNIKKLLSYYPDINFDTWLE